MTSPVRSLVLAVLFMLCCANVVLAQDQGVPPGPYRPLFGGATEDTARQTLETTVSFAQAYDDNALAIKETAIVPQTFQESGVYAEFSPQLSFEQRGTAQLRVTAGSDFRYYERLGEVISLGHYAGADFSYSGRKTKVRLGQGFSYTPASLTGFFQPVVEPIANAVLPSPTAYALSQQRYFGLHSSASIDRQMSRRIMASLNTDFGYTKFTDEEAASTLGFVNLSSGHIVGRLTAQLDRNMSFVSRYTYGRATYVQGSEPVDQHTVEVGIQYQRPLSPARKTRFEATIGPTMFETAEIVPIVPIRLDVTSLEVVSTAQIDNQPRRQIGVTANVSFARDLTRTWGLTASYQRGLAYVETLRNAVFNDTTTITARGFAGRRTDLAISGSYARGSLAIGADNAPDYSTYSGNVRLRFALTRKLATYVDYLHYYYHFSNRIQLPLSYPRGLSRNAVQAGLDLWVPVMSHR